MTIFKRVSMAGVLGLTLSISGCSHSKPTSGDGEDVAKRILVKNCKGDCIDITDFTKADGVMGERDGTKFYMIEYEAVGKSKVSCYCDLPKVPQMEPVSFGEFHATTDKDKLPTQLPVGTEVKFRGTMMFHQSENGWRPEEITDRDKDGKVIYY